jgi:hypothetical protein
MAALRDLPSRPDRRGGRRKKWRIGVAEKIQIDTVDRMAQGVEVKERRLIVSNQAIEELTLGNKQIINITALYGCAISIWKLCTGLKQPLGNIIIFPLIHRSPCVNLKSLNLAFNDVSSTAPLGTLEKLTNLNLSHNKLKAVVGLPGSLQVIKLSNNELSTIDGLRGVVAAKEIWINANGMGGGWEVVFQLVYYLFISLIIIPTLHFACGSLICPSLGQPQQCVGRFEQAARAQNLDAAEKPVLFHRPAGHVPQRCH